jgi:hypothetical protein
MASILMDAERGLHGRRSGRRLLVRVTHLDASRKPIRVDALVEALMQVTPRGAA